MCSMSYGKWKIQVRKGLTFSSFTSQLRNLEVATDYLCGSEVLLDERERLVEEKGF